MTYLLGSLPRSFFSGSFTSSSEAPPGRRHHVGAGVAAGTLAGKTRNGTERKPTRSATKVQGTTTNRTTRTSGYSEPRSEGFPRGEVLVQGGQGAMLLECPCEPSPGRQEHEVAAESEEHQSPSSQIAL